MGDRAQVKVTDGSEAVYLYTHWNGSQLLDVLRTALARGEGRWDDAPYLTRIIFNEMTKDDITGTTGYGIWSAELDGWTVVVDVQAGMIVFEDSPESMSFLDFVEVGP